MPSSVCFFAFFCSSAALIIQPLVRPIANGTAAQVNETNSDDTDDDDDDDDDDSGGDAIVAVNFLAIGKERSRQGTLSDEIFRATTDG